MYYYASSSSSSRAPVSWFLYCFYIQRTNKTIGIKRVSTLSKYKCPSLAVQTTVVHWEIPLDSLKMLVNQSGFVWRRKKPSMKVIVFVHVRACCRWHVRGGGGERPLLLPQRSSQRRDWWPEWVSLSALWRCSHPGSPLCGFCFQATGSCSSQLSSRWWTSTSPPASFCRSVQSCCFFSSDDDI